MVRGDRRNVCLPMFYMVILTIHLTGSLGAQIKKLAFNNNGLGSYNFEYETSDGSYRREEGGLITDAETQYMLVRGEYGYLDPQGKLHTMQYTADANGYHPRIDSNYIRFNDRRII